MSWVRVQAEPPPPTSGFSPPGFGWTDAGGGVLRKTADKEDADLFFRLGAEKAKFVTLGNVLLFDTATGQCAEFSGVAIPHGGAG